MSVRKRSWQSGGETKEVWIVDITFHRADGTVAEVKRRSPVNTRRGAEQFERDLRQALLDGTYGMEADAPPTLAEFVPSFLAHADANNKPSTAVAKRGILNTHLLPRFGQTPLDKIGLEAVENLKAELLKEGAKPKTVKNVLLVLQRALHLAKEYGRIREVPTFKMPKIAPPTAEFLTPEEGQRVLDAAPAEWRTMILTAMRTGMRLGELLALRWENVDFPACKVVVRASAWRDQIVTTKNGRIREVPMTDTVRQALLEHRAGQVGRIGGGWVFCHADGARYTHKDVQHVMTRACRASGIAKEVSWHKGGRHTFASALAASGRVSLQTIQELGGWASLDLVQRYSHLMPNAKRDAVAVLDGDQGATKLSADHATSRDSSDTAG